MHRHSIGENASQLQLRNPHEMVKSMKRALLLRVGYWALGRVDRGYIEALAATSLSARFFEVPEGGHADLAVELIDSIHESPAVAALAINAAVMSDDVEVRSAGQTAASYRVAS